MQDEEKRPASVASIAPPDFVTDTLPQLDVGAYAKRINLMIAEAVKSVHQTEKKAKITLELELSRISNTDNMMNLKHVVKIKRHTLRGDHAESDVGESALYASKKGNLTFVPDNQESLDL